MYLFIFIKIKNIKNFYTNVRTNKLELLLEFWSVCPFKVLGTLSFFLSFFLLLPRITPAMVETSIRICDNVVYPHIHRP